MDEDEKETNQTVCRVLFRTMLQTYSVPYITVETQYTIHYIEKMSINSDRGRFKWIAEMKSNYWDDITKSDDSGAEARRSHIDGGDLFPRYIFLEENIVSELFEWFKVRRLYVTDIKEGKL